MAELEKDGEFEDSPHGWAARWQAELSAARKWLEPWHAEGEKIEKRYRDERPADDVNQKRWNLFPANIETQQAILYGQVPKASVTRKHADADDDEARVAATILERHLNCDIAKDTDGYVAALGHALIDRLLPGLAQGRIYFDAKFEKASAQPAKLGQDGTELAPEVPETERVVAGTEQADISHVHWRDQLWSPCRMWREARWWAHRVPMRKKQVAERFGEHFANVVPYTAKGEGDPRKDDPWARADVWEIWDKESRQVFWWVEGLDRVLDQKPDTLGLEGFFPCPRPLLAHVHNSSTIPRPDFLLCKDLYNQVDSLTTRIDMLIGALKVAGLYDKKAGADVERLVKSGPNELIPADNWAMHAEGGGLRGSIDWFPLEQVASTLDKLREMRQETVAAAYQISGMSDIMRGQAAEGGVTATEQSIKARFASVRMSALQDEFARFASDLQRLKAEVICKHYSEQTIIERSNILQTPDAQAMTKDGRPLVQAAVKLLKSRWADYRVEVKPESVNLQDFTALRQERTEVISALAGFFQAVFPIGQALPGSMPFLLQIAKLVVAATRGGAAIESVFDRAIQAAEQAAQQPPSQAPPDPKLQAQQLKAQTDQMKAQTDLAKEQFKFQAGLKLMQAETEQKAIQEQNQAVANIAEAKAKHALVRGAPPPAFGPGRSGGSAP